MEHLGLGGRFGDKGGTGWAPHPEQPPQRLLSACREGGSGLLCQSFPKSLLGCLERAVPSAEQGLMPAEALVPAVPSPATASTALFSWQLQNISHSQMCTPDCLPGPLLNLLLLLGPGGKEQLTAFPDPPQMGFNPVVLASF